MPSKMVPSKKHEKVWQQAKSIAGKTYNEGDEAFWPVVVEIYLSKVKAKGLKMPDIKIKSPKLRKHLDKIKVKSMRRACRVALRKVLAKAKKDAAVIVQQVPPNKAPLRMRAAKSSLQIALRTVDQVIKKLEDRIQRGTPIGDLLGLIRIFCSNIDGANTKIHAIQNAVDSFSAMRQGVGSKDTQLEELFTKVVKEAEELVKSSDEILAYVNKDGVDNPKVLLPEIQALKITLGPVLEDISTLADVFKKNEGIFKALRSSFVEPSEE